LSLRAFARPSGRERYRHERRDGAEAGSPASQMVNPQHSVFHLLSSFEHDEKLPKY
jgi:hypothetical protein